MAQPIKIGFLSPYSGVYPHYAQHLIAGLMMGMYKDPLRQNEVQFIPAYTNKGDPKSTIEAANKLLFFDQVDILSGLISYTAAPDIMPLIETHNKLGVFFDSGEYIPYFSYLSPNMFYCSQQIWQSQFALGYWAHKEYGNTGMIVMPVYEAGYHLNASFIKGSAIAGATNTLQHILAHDPANPRKLNLDDFFKEVQDKQPTFIHAIFAGTLGNSFLVEWKKSKYSKSIPLLVVENMAYEDILEDVKHLNIEIHAATSWNRSSELPSNKYFVKIFESLGGQMANLFGLLGYEAGLGLKGVHVHLAKHDMDAVRKALQKESITGPRGDRNFYPLSGFSLPVNDILRIKTDSYQTFKTVVSQGKGLRFDAPEFKQIHDENISGWQNPYMCI